VGGGGGAALLATCGADDAVRVFGVAAGSGAIEPRGCAARAHAGDVNAVRWHKALPLLATGGDDCLVKLWLWAE